MINYILPFLTVIAGVPKEGYNKVEKYAVIVIGSCEENTKYFDDVDKIDRNLESIEMSEIYETLKKAGFEDKNMFFLYPEPYEPNFDETSEEFKEFYLNTEYSHAADEENLREIIKNVKRRADENDIFIFVLSTHGGPEGYALLGTQILDYSEIQEMLSGFRSKTNVAIYGTCFSGIFLERVRLDNFASFSITSKEKVGWVDRNFNMSTILTDLLFDGESDIDEDGYVEPEEVVGIARSVAKKYKPFIEWYWKNEYEDDVEPGSVDLNPYFYSGRDFEPVKVEELGDD